MRNALTKFVRGNCAHFSGVESEECLGYDIFGKPFRKPGKCRVMEGKPCEYFKDYVLGKEGTKYPHLCFVRDPAYEASVRKLYKRIDHSVIEVDDTRRCPDCQAALKPRQRYCEKCSTKRRKKTQRDKHKEYRRNNRG